MKKIFFSLFLILNINAFSQDLKDRIYPKNGDSIVCKITSATPNWISYNYERKDKIRSNNIHMAEIEYYIHRGVKRKPYKKQRTLVPFLKKNVDAFLRIL